MRFFNSNIFTSQLLRRRSKCILSCSGSGLLAAWRASSTRRWWSTTSHSWPCASALLAFHSPRKKVGLTSVGFKTCLFQCFPRQTFVPVIASNHTVLLSQDTFLHFFGHLSPSQCFSFILTHCCLKIVLINLSCLLSQRLVSSLLTKT